MELVSTVLASWSDGAKRRDGRRFFSPDEQVGALLATDILRRLGFVVDPAMDWMKRSDAPATGAS
jgi:hypothetical protein